MIIIPLSQGKFALIDKKDFNKIKQFKWCATQPNKKHTWYAQAHIPNRKRKNAKQKSILMHRLIMGFPRNKDIDHIDYNGLNNTRNNLRVCSRAQNVIHSRIKIGKSGFRGVVKRTKNCYQAQIKNSKNIPIYLGSFKTAIEAAKAYNKASLKYHGEFGIQNIVS